MRLGAGTRSALVPRATIHHAPAPSLRAGGGPALAQESSAGLQPLWAAFLAFARAVGAWFKRLFARPDAVPMPPAGPGPAEALILGAGIVDGGILSGVLTVSPGPDGAVRTAGARWASPRGTANAVLRVDGQGLSGEANLEASVGNAWVRGTAQASGEGVGGTVTVASPGIQATVAGGVADGKTAIAGTLQAKVGTAGTLQAEGALLHDSEGSHGRAELSLSDPSTRLALSYQQDGLTHAAGGTLTVQGSHSVLGMGGDFAWSPEGDGGRLYGRWQSDAIGEQIGGFTVRGALEAGALKMPGQDWRGYAAGRVTAEKDNAALFVQVDQGMGQGFGRAGAGVTFGAQLRF